jgi:hypothetical protein
LHAQRHWRIPVPAIPGRMMAAAPRLQGHRPGAKDTVHRQAMSIFPGARVANSTFLMIAKTYIPITLESNQGQIQVASCEPPPSEVFRP